MPKLNEAERQYLADNWATQSCREIAAKIGCHHVTVTRVGERMGLGKKPNPKAVAVGVAQRSRETSTSKTGQSFFGMVDSVFDTLVAKRKALLDRLQQLAKLPNDGRGKVALEVASTNDKLRKTEAALIDAEELQEASRKYRPKKPDATTELQTFEEMTTHLDTQLARTTEGRLSEKVRIAAALVQSDWCELHEFEDGCLDPVMLIPGGSNDNT